MALLRELTTGRPLPLAARTLVGRGPRAGLRIDDLRVSGEHASLRWTGRGWEIRDLGSRNGTFVDGVRLAPGEDRPLPAGCRLGFGSEAATLVVEDAGAPGPVAVERGSGERWAAVDGLLALPSAEQPELVVFADPRGRWVIEQGDAARPVADGEVVVAAGRSFELAIPEPLEGTAAVEAGPTLDTIALRFGVSQDEEHVVPTVVHQGRAIPLEPREHAYALLTLARARLADAALPTAEQGWLDRDRLLRMLQLDPNGLNVAFYRARGQLAAAGVEGAAGLVEVRRGQRRIGLPPDRLQVGPLDG